MTDYIFKKNSEIFIAEPTSTSGRQTNTYSLGTNTGILAVEDFSISQSRVNQGYKTKTLHEPHKLSDGSLVTKVNPAKFQMTILVPTVTDVAIDIIMDAILKPITNSNFDIVAFSGHKPTQNDADFKVQVYNCFISNAEFIIETNSVLKLKVQGEGTIMVGEHIDFFSFFGQLSQPTQFQKVDYLSAKLPDSTDIPCVVSLTVEVQNNINWLPSQTLNNTLDGVLSYPQQATVDKRTVSGSITAYVKTPQVSTIGGLSHSHELNKTLSIVAGESASKGFKFNLLGCTYTSRLSTGTVFTTTYDWEMTDNPTNFSDSSSDTRSYIKIQT
jgi:hypothetical protein